MILTPIEIKYIQNKNNVMNSTNINFICYHKISNNYSVEQEIKRLFNQIKNTIKFRSDLRQFSTKTNQRYLKCLFRIMEIFHKICHSKTEEQKTKLRFSTKKLCEENLSLKDLLKYREWAFQETRIEAKRYYNSSKDGQINNSFKPLLEIWTKTIYNQNSFKVNTKRNDDIPIEFESIQKEKIINQIKLKYKFFQIFILFSYCYLNLELLIILNILLKILKYFSFVGLCKYHIKLLKKGSIQKKKIKKSSYINTFQLSIRRFLKNK